MRGVASKRRLWNRFGRLFGGVVIACFFLPFFGISCDHLDVVTISGADMVGGCRPGGLLTAEKQHDNAKHAESGLDVKVENVPVEPLAIGAFACALIAFGLAWWKTRNALLGACALSIVGLGLLVALFFKVGGDLETQVTEDMKHQTSNKIIKKEEISTGSRYGLWMTAFGLASIAVVTGLALREPEA